MTRLILIALLALAACSAPITRTANSINDVLKPHDETMQERH